MEVKDDEEYHKVNFEKFKTLSTVFMVRMRGKKRFYQIVMQAMATFIYFLLRSMVF